MATDQQVRLNLVISATDEAAIVFADFAKSIEASVRTAMDALESLNSFKLEPLVSTAVVDELTAVTDNAKRLNTELVDVANGGAKQLVTVFKHDLMDAFDTVKVGFEDEVIASAKASEQTEANLKRIVTAATGTTDEFVVFRDKSTEALNAIKNTAYMSSDELKSAFEAIKSELRGTSLEFVDAANLSDAQMKKIVSAVRSQSIEVTQSLKSEAKEISNLHKGLDFGMLQFAGQQIQQYGKQLTDFFGKATIAAATFQQNIYNTAASLNANLPAAAKLSKEQLAALNNEALNLGSNGYQSANQIADAMNVMAKQGLSYQQIMGGAIQAASNVAAANQEDLSTTSNVISDIVHEMGGSLLQQYGTMGTSMQRVGDIMTVALHHSRLSMTDFLNSMKYAGPQASNMGVSFSDLAATISVLGQHGIRSSQAGTTLRRAIQELAAPSKTAYAEMLDLGFVTKDGGNIFLTASGKLKSMADVQAILHDRLQQLTPAQRENSLQAMFSMYAVSGMTAVTNQTPASFKAMTDAMAKSGVAQAILTEKSKGVGFEIQRMQAQWATLIKQIGELFLPIATKVIGVLSTIMTAIQHFTQAHPALAKILFVVGAIVGVILVLGGGLLTIVGTFAMLISAIRDLIPVTEAATVAQGELDVAMDANPIGLIIAAIALLAVGAYELIKHWSAVSKFFTALWTDVLAVVKTMWGSIVAFFEGIWKWATAFFGKWGVDILAIIVPFIGIPLLIANHWKQIEKWLSDVWTAVSNLATNVFKSIGTFFSNWLSDQLNVFKERWNAITTFLTSAWKGIVDVAKTVWNALKNFFLSYWEAIINFFKSVWNNLRNLLTSGASNAVKGILSEFGRLGTFFENLGKNALQWGENIIGMFIKGVKGAIGGVGKVVGNIAGTIKSLLGFHSPTEQGPASDSDTWMPNMMNMFSDGITKQLPTFKATLTGVASSIQQMVAPTGANYGGNVSNVSNNTYGYSPSAKSSGPTALNITIQGGNTTNNKDLANQLAKAIRTQMSVVSA